MILTTDIDNVSFTDLAYPGKYKEMLRRNTFCRTALEKSNKHFMKQAAVQDDP
jgi:hypothetical protein